MCAGYYEIACAGAMVSGIVQGRETTERTHLQPLDDFAKDVVYGPGVAKVLRELGLAMRERRPRHAG